MITVPIYKITPTAQTPTYATSGSACFDLYADLSPDMLVTVYTKHNEQEQRAVLEGTVILHPGDRALIPTGLIFDIPTGWQLKLIPRSGISLKQGCTLANAVGVVDSDYVEQTFVVLHNTSKAKVKIQHHTRIAQGELIQAHQINFSISQHPPGQKTERIGGFGHTG